MDLFGDDWLRSVPVGLVMFVGTAFAFARRAWLKRNAWASFPSLGERLGLQHTPAEMIGAAGVLKGSYGRHQVRIESDARARVVVVQEKPLEVDLRNYERWVRLPPGRQPFAFSDRRVNTWLKTRLAAPDVAAAVASDGQLTALLHRLQDHPALREFSASEGRVEVVYDFGARGLFPVDEAERALVLVDEFATRLTAVAARSAVGGEHTENGAAHQGPSVPS